MGMLKNSSNTGAGSGGVRWLVTLHAMLAGPGQLKIRLQAESCIFLLEMSRSWYLRDEGRASPAPQLANGSTEAAEASSRDGSASRSTTRVRTAVARSIIIIIIRRHLFLGLLED